MLDLFFGAAEHRLLLGHLPMTGEFIAEVVDVILAGVARPGWGRGPVRKRVPVRHRGSLACWPLAWLVTCSRSTASPARMPGWRSAARIRLSGPEIHAIRACNATQSASAVTAVQLDAGSLARNDAGYSTYA